MTDCYILIDYENVQPPSLEPLAGDHYRIMVFTGARQARLPTAFAASMQRFGARAEYVQLATSSSNLMDFHIAYYLGKLTAKNPGARFYVIAKDKGYDPLIKHLNQIGIVCHRCMALKDIEDSGRSAASAPKVKALSIAALADRVEENLAKRKQAKPATVRTLTNTIMKDLGGISESVLKNVLNTLKQRGVFTIDGVKVVYRERH